MRKLAKVVAVGLLFGCDGGDSNPTAPPEPSSRWLGTREIVEVLEGDGTCMADELKRRGREAVEMRLPSDPAVEPLAYVNVAEAQDSYTAFFRQSGVEIAFSPWKYSRTCWFTSFTCNGRAWSYCRGYHDFVGTRILDRVEGEQIGVFAARDGRSQYAVEVRYKYALDRQ